MQTIEEALDKLETSRFRAGFHLTPEDRAYYAARGEDVIRAHARDFVASRLAPDWPANDGRQTPCGATRCSRPCTPPPAAAGGA